ncbi:hypothetical protein FHX08_002067 [Rhizobium sp. BK529]|uniref:hypothetical protein n=1 Tax=Rhizobium sp. BK529 TaxID=2586983 RepID=UPI001611D64C|nr:hypothetical protein [Rhizobium sp. BK529]MBB3591723.1 hypothetical protein [Rhizobium sp. BK529]
MTPDHAIAQLDDQLLKHGEDILLSRRVSGGPDAEVTCRALVRGIRAEQIVGTITQLDLNVIISPTQILTAGWPSGDPPAPGAVDPRLPRVADFLVIKGRERQVKMSDPIYLHGQWVRCNLVVAG